MKAEQHAERILESWIGSDPVRFETELESALKTCLSNESVSCVELEKRELLESVVQRFRIHGLSLADKADQLCAAPISLLQHLRQLPRHKTAGAV